MELPPDWRDVPLASVAEVRLGRQRSPKNHAGDQMRPYVRAANVSWSGLRLDDVKEMNFTDSEMDTFRLEAGDLLLGEASGSPREVGKPALWRGEIADCAFQNTLVRVRPRGPDPEYLLHYFRHQAMSGRFAAAARGVGIRHLGSDALAKWRLPLPPLSEQRRIAEVLDGADALRAKRGRALALLDGLKQSIFLDMFGDTLHNSKRWPRVALGDLACRFSDGPFGSNLKSSHYTTDGVRVVRLQNIGVGHFVATDAAFVSEGHFASLRKHECLPGDVLVGTLGDPNLRACIQPESLPRALNKADCVQLRPDPRVSTSEYLCWLINSPGTIAMAQSLMLGQTRVRISMGRLRGLQVSRPPLELQRLFSERVRSIAFHERVIRSRDTHMGALFASLQQRAFAGEL